MIGQSITIGDYFIFSLLEDNVFIFKNGGKRLPTIDVLNMIKCVDFADKYTHLKGITINCLRNMEPSYAIELLDKKDWKRLQKLSVLS